MTTDFTLNQTLTLKLGERDRQRLEAIAQSEELTLSAIIRRLIRERASELGQEAPRR